MIREGLTLIRQTSLDNQTRELLYMRFSADCDSEEEEFPVDNASHSPGQSSLWNQISDSDDDVEDLFSDVSTHCSPRGNLDAWVIILSRKDHLTDMSTKACNKQ